jgi:hypothetical protein
VCFSLSRLAKARGKAIEKKKKEMSYLLAYGWRLNINSIKENGGGIYTATRVGIIGKKEDSMQSLTSAGANKSADSAIALPFLLEAVD